MVETFCQRQPKNKLLSLNYSEEVAISRGISKHSTLNSQLQFCFLHLIKPCFMMTCLFCRTQAGSTLLGEAKASVVVKRSSPPEGAKGNRRFHTASALHCVIARAKMKLFYSAKSGYFYQFGQVYFLVLGEKVFMRVLPCRKNALKRDKKWVFPLHSRKESLYSPMKRTMCADGEHFDLFSYIYIIRCFNFRKSDLWR